MSGDHSEQENDQGWLRLELLTTRPDTDAAHLVQIGALGIEVQDDQTFMDDEEVAPVPDGISRLIAFFDVDIPTAELRRRVERDLDEVELVSLAQYTDRSWETAWMKYFEAIELSQRVAVGPPWDQPEAPDDGLAIVIEPGMAFGTGTHETTRLCARIIDEILQGRQVANLLDVGCGSAILSMIAAGLGATHVVGIDVDATAIEVAQANIEKNGYSNDQIELSTRPLADFDEKFEVVVANILAPILLELRESLFDVVAAGGDLVLSGISAEQLDDMRAAFKSDDFAEVDCRVDGDWVALHLRRDTE